MFAERSSRKMPPMMGSSLPVPTSWPGFKMPWLHGWPKLSCGSYVELRENQGFSMATFDDRVHGPTCTGQDYNLHMSIIFYVGIPNKTTNPSVHMYIYTHTKKHISWPWFFPNKTHRIHIYIYTYIINHLGMIPLAFTIIPVTSLVTKNETRVPETVAFSTSSTLFCDTFGVELAKWRGNVAVLLWWRFSMIILNQISFGLSWLGATLRESWVICANIRQEGRVKRGLNP